MNQDLPEKESTTPYLKANVTNCKGNPQYRGFNYANKE